MTPRRLVIVRQDHFALYRYLRDRLADVARVEVILDRREAGPSAEGSPGAAGSGWERRQPLGRRERERWWAFGYRLADGIGEERLSPETGSGRA